MRRFFVILTLSGALCAGLSATAAADGQPRAKLRGFVCQHALDPAGRAISLTAVMRPLVGTTKLAMRFELLKRANRKSRPSSLSGHDLKTWISPTDPPTLGQMPGDVWIVHHPVVNLAAPALYRFRVSFRWTGAGGRVLGTATKLGPLCFQPEKRADLVIPPGAGLPVKTWSNGRDRYKVTVRNRGKTAAGPFNVQLAIGTGQPLEQTIQQLAPHSQTVLYFFAQACTPGDQLAVTADPEDQVDEADRTNNVLEGMCQPAAAASSTRRGRALHRA